MKKADWSRRADLAERMDAADGSETLLYRTLDQFQVTNRLFSRYPEILTQGVIRVMRRNPSRHYRLADLGAGGCDVSRWLIRRCRREGLKLAIRAVDSDPRILRYALAANRDYPEILSVEADVMDTAAWGNADFVFANHLLHHLPDAACITLLRRLEQAGPQSYLISDIVRSRRSAWAFRLLVAPFFQHSFLREDGLISIRRTFNRDEVVRLVEQAYLSHRPQIRFYAPARFLISGGVG